MNQEAYISMHHAADRMALEASRNVTAGKEADCYIKNYKKVIEYLISEYKKHDQ